MQGGAAAVTPRKCEGDFVVGGATFIRSATSIPSCGKLGMSESLSLYRSSPGAQLSPVANLLRFKGPSH